MALLDVIAEPTGDGSYLAFLAIVAVLILVAVAFAIYKHVTKKNAAVSLEAEPVVEAVTGEQK